METKLHHVALNVADFDWYTAFFQNAFCMKQRKASGSAPNRKVWFYEGVQLNESPARPECGSLYDHISITVPNIRETVQTALHAGCEALSDGENWFALPNGIRVELMQK